MGAAFEALIPYFGLILAARWGMLRNLPQL